MIGKIKLALPALIVLMLLSSCSTYNSHFGCGKSRGADCMPMDKVDRLISSGEIEIYTASPSKKCSGLMCKKSKIYDNRSPELKGEKLERIEIIN